MNSPSIERLYETNMTAADQTAIHDQIVDAMVLGEELPDVLPAATTERVRSLFAIALDQTIDVKSYLGQAEQMIRSLDQHTARYDARLYLAGLSVEALQREAPTYMQSLILLLAGMRQGMAATHKAPEPTTAKKTDPTRRPTPASESTAAPSPRQKPARSPQPKAPPAPAAPQQTATMRGGGTELSAAIDFDELADIFGLPEEASWQERALCAQTDPDAFFPEKGGSTRAAKKICTGCEVRAECLEYALQHDERAGIWGGLSERERRRLKRRTV